MYIVKDKTEMKNRPKIVAIDFDDTIAKDSFPDCTNSETINGAKYFINKLYDKGFYVIIWTCRYMSKHIYDVKKFLADNEIKYHSINENYPHLQFKPHPKIYYDYLVDDKCLLKVDWKWEYCKILTQFAESSLFNIHPKMKQHYFDRTKSHIESVQKFYSDFIKSNRDYFSEDFGKHDLIKFEDNEIVPYIATTWQYYCKDNNIKFEISKELQLLMNFATEHHVKNSSHHPEYWLKDKSRQTIPTNDRDKFDPNALETIDVSETMPKSAIVEMCADWCAMSKERGNTPFEWVEKVIDKRWKFGKEKTDFIHFVLRQMWNK